ncbi:MAG: hypothetical protein WAO98_01560 [Alphaproteobacteria bacterium]
MFQFSDPICLEFKNVAAFTTVRQALVDLKAVVTREVKGISLTCHAPDEQHFAAIEGYIDTTFKDGRSFIKVSRQTRCALTPAA